MDPQSNNRLSGSKCQFMHLDFRVRIPIKRPYEIQTYSSNLVIKKKMS